MSFDHNNCALGDQCKCADEVLADSNFRYWECANWGRSSLKMPALVHSGSHFTGTTADKLRKQLDERKRKQDKWEKATEERLGNDRAANPVQHLRKRGIHV